MSNATMDDDGVPFTRTSSGRRVEAYIDKVSSLLVTREERRRAEDEKLAEEWKDLARKYAPKLDAPDSLEEEDESEEEWPTQQSEDIPVVGILKDPSLAPSKKSAAVQFTTRVLEYDDVKNAEKNALQSELKEHGIPSKPFQRNPWEEHVGKLLEAKVKYEQEKKRKAAEKASRKASGERRRSDWNEQVEKTVEYARKCEAKQRELVQMKREKKQRAKLEKEAKDETTRSKWDAHVAATLNYVKSLKDGKPNDKDDKELEEYGELESGLERFMAKLGIRKRGQSLSASRSVSPSPPQEASHCESAPTLLAKLQEERDSAIAKAAYWESKYRALLAETGKFPS
jgi:hypothetical protein